MIVSPYKKKPLWMTDQDWLTSQMAGSAGGIETSYVPPVTPQPYVQATPYTTPDSMGVSPAVPGQVPGGSPMNNSFRGVRNQRRRSMGL